MTDSTDRGVGLTERTTSFRLANDQEVVEIGKLVSKGERAEITAGGESVKLDALLLESTSWQREPEGFRGILDTDVIQSDPVTLADTSDIESRKEELTVSSEYSHAVLSSVETKDGPGLLIETPARGVEILLGVPTLREFAGLEDTFRCATWFKTPAGPESDPLEGPH